MSQYNTLKRFAGIFATMNEKDDVPPPTMEETNAIGRDLLELIETVEKLERLVHP